MDSKHSIQINGRLFQVDDTPDNRDFWGWVQGNRWEPHTFRIYDRYLTPDMTYLDLGAWIGPTILYAASLSKRAIAVEPDPVAFPILKANIRANDLSVELHQLAIADFDGTIKLGSGLLGASTTRSNPNAGGSIGAWGPDQVFDSPCLTLRHFVENAQIDSPLFIKMDTEGAEEQIFKDLDFFRERQPVLYLSLHPFWWKDADSTWEQVKELAKIYGTVLHGVTFQPITDHLHNELLFVPATANNK